ncbi:MAG: ABC transporter ATP-binding protein [Thermodesulfobacteriota bacterium]|nr:ABC transporter ATP-binding protein [Thermodesulfobacteriota bacterium]
MNTEPILKATGMRKLFGGVVALQDVSFKLRQGEFLGLIGPNGSGKTTLINLITGFIKPDRGEVIYKGKKITGRRPNRIANLGIGRTFQMVKPFHGLPTFKNLIVPLCSPRVKNQLAEGKYGDRDAIAIDLLEEVGFERDSSVPYQSADILPHGYLKRMELARCLALQPDLIILDELFSGMSMAEVASTMSVIEKLQMQGQTIIMVEHRIKELFRIADRIIVLNWGMKIAEGPPQDIIENKEVRKAYIGRSELE